MQIRVEGLTKRFGDKQVLKELDFTVDEGQFLALLGPSGCGKTTLLNILAGFLEVEQGRVVVGGDVWCKPGYALPSEKRNVGMVFQDFALWPHMNVFDNIAFGLKLRKVTATDIRRRVNEVLETVRMTGYEDKFPHQLSGGQKQRIAIARALAPWPSVLLMDEPLSSLDAKLREQMRWDMLDIIRRAGTTTVYVTHDQAEALSMADKIVLLNEGSIEQEGAPNEMYHRPRTSFTATFLGASNLIAGIVEWASDNTLRLDCHGHVLHAEGVGRIGERHIISVRPTDICIYGELNKPQSTRELAVFEGVIAQRAFHGVHWRYRVTLIGTPSTEIEVWDERELPLNGKVFLAIPSKQCLVLEETKSAVQS